MEWIKVEDMLPEENKVVLVASSTRQDVEIDYFFKARWMRREFTHWMPLPEPPKE